MVRNRPPWLLRRTVSLGVGLIALPLLIAAPAPATPLAPFIDLTEVGLTQVDDAVGLEGGFVTPRNLNVNVGGNVRFALLYWAGRQQPCTVDMTGNCPFAQPYKDQQAIFNGTPITGTVIGQETQPTFPGGGILNIGYFADVTSLVSAAGPGAKTFTISDGNAASNLSTLNGASLVVAYTAAASTTTYRMLVWDNLDFAFGDDPTPGGTRTTAPVSLGHGAASIPRQGKLTLGVGKATSAGADRTTVGGNPDLVGCLDASSGARWDTDSVPVSIPPGSSNLVVQVNSAPAGSNPDALLWMFATLLVPVSEPAVPSQNDCPEPSAAPPAGPSTGGDATKPLLERVALVPRRFKAARRGAAVAATGSSLRFILSEPAAVSFRVERARKGRRVGRRCVAPRRSNRHRRACVRFVALRGRLARQGVQGSNRRRFRGRWRGRKLAPGRYRLRSVAVDAAGNRSATRRAPFRIIR